LGRPPRIVEPRDTRSAAQWRSRSA
jgi:hypothetical protein